MKRTVTPIVKLTPEVLCNSGIVKVQNKSVNMQFVVWKGWLLADTPSIAAGSQYIPRQPSNSDTSIVAQRSTNPSDSSAIVAYKDYGSYTITLKAQSTGCPEFDYNKELKVWPRPVIRFKPNTRKLCVGNLFFIRDSSEVVQTDPRGLGPNFRNLSWEVDFGDSTILKSVYKVNQFYNNPGLTGRIYNHRYTKPGTYVVRLKSFVGNSDCPGEDSMVVVVQENPTPKFSVRRDACDNSKVTLTNLMTDTADFYEYIFQRGLSSRISFQKTDRSTFTVTVPYIPPGDSTFYQVFLKAIKITGLDTCFTLSAPIRIGVAPTPVAAITISPSSDGCHPMTNISLANTSFNLAADTSNRFFWDFGNGNTSTLENPPIQTFLNAGPVLAKDTVRFKITRKDGCIFSVQRDVLIFPSPNVTLIVVDSVCSGVPVQFEATGNNIAAYDWRFTDYDNSNTFAARPEKTFLNFTNDAKVYTYELTAKTINNCPQTVQKTIKIFPQPQVDISIFANQSHFCSPLPVRFSYQNPAGATKYSWYFSGGDSLKTTVDSAFTKLLENNTGGTQNYNVRMVASNNGGCSTSVSRTINLNPRVEASYIQNAPATCSPAALSLVSTSTPGADRLTWKIGSLVFQNVNTVNRAIANGSYDRDTTITIQLIARNSLVNSCADTSESILLVHPKPIVSGVSIPVNVACSPFQTSLTGAGLGLKYYSWDFGDGSTFMDSVPVANHLFENYNATADRNYVIKLVGSNIFGCADTATRTLAVKPYTKAGIIAVDTAGCTPFAARFSSAASVNANSFEWTFAGLGTSTLANPNQTFANNSDSVQRYKVRLVAKKREVLGCPDTAYQTIEVWPKPVPAFSLNTTIGCGPLPVRFTNSSTGYTSAYYVINSGGVSDTVAIGANPVFDTTFSNPNLLNKTIEVELITLNEKGCLQKATQFITVYADVTAKFEEPEEGCQPLSIKFKNQSINPSGNYLWNFGDGNTSREKNPRHFFQYSGSKDTTYTIKLTSISAIGSCVKTDSVKVKVHGRPDLDIDVTPERIQLPQNTISLINNTSLRPDWSYYWTFGDGKSDTSRSRRFNHIYTFGNEDFTDTNFTVQVIAKGPFGCRDTATQRIVIQPEAPKVNFGYSDSIGCSPLTVAFYNRTIYGREYEWDFGDKAISTDKNPIHAYITAGTFRVKLTAKGFGGTRTLVKDSIITVKPFPKATFYATRFEVIIPEEQVKFVPYETCADCKYAWTVSDGTTDTAANPIRTFNREGFYSASLKVTSPNGCSSEYTLENAVKAITRNLAFAPNVMRPKFKNGGYTKPGDKDNTIFYPFTQGAKAIDLKIYNRWGILLYQSKEIGRGWDGFLKNGEMAGQDSYVYSLEVTFLNGETNKKVGDLTVLH